MLFTCILQVQRTNFATFHCREARPRATQQHKIFFLGFWLLTTIATTAAPPPATDIIIIVVVVVVVVVVIDDDNISII